MASFPYAFEPSGLRLSLIIVVIQPSRSIGHELSQLSSTDLRGLDILRSALSPSINPP